MVGSGRPKRTDAITVPRLQPLKHHFFESSEMFNLHTASASGRGTIQEYWQWEVEHWSLVLLL